MSMRDRWGIKPSGLPLSTAQPTHPNDYKFLPIAPRPDTQALTSTTFVPPPLDGSMRLAEMFDYNAEHSPNHPIFEFSDDSGNVTSIKWPEANRAVHRAGRYILDVAAGRPRPQLTSGGDAVVAILASADTVTYATILFGVQRAGFVPFAVSPRNSAAAVVHLLTKMQAEILLVSPDAPMQELAASALQMMREAGTPTPHQAPIPLFEDIYLDESVPFEPLSPTEWTLDSPTLILHSSGSTAFPKPVTYSNYRLLNFGQIPFQQEQDTTGMRIGCHNLAMFHGMGVVMISCTITAGSIMTTLKPRFPPPAPTPEMTLTAVEATNTDVIICVPSFIEEWARDPENIARLQRTKGVIYGGGPLAKTAGDKLAAAGVPIYTMYGATEYGIMGMILPQPPLKDWDYFRFMPGVKYHLNPQGDGTVQLVLLASPFQTPSIINTVIDGVPGYDTNDILMPHATEPGWFKVYGRADDQIMHSTGEKTNPGPLEHILDQDPHVRASVIFGRGKFNCGVIVEPVPDEQFDPADAEKLAQFRNKIWPTVEKMNEYAPQHSRIFKEMIAVASPAKPFTYTAKRTARRGAIINDYADEIEALYAAAAETSQTDVPLPNTWTSLSAKDFVRAVITRVLKQDVGDEDDIFQRGCDSLEATWIRNSILHALRETTPVDTRAIPTNFVYQHPSVASLAVFVAGLAGEGEAGDPMEKAVAFMHEMVNKYTHDLPKHTPSGPAPAGEVVLVTGTTGGIGCSLLSWLVEMPGISCVYALNRRSRVPLAERQRAALQERGYDTEAILASSKLALLEAAVEEEKLGLSDEIYQELRTSVTHIIHNAWPVNFNMSLRSFEPSLRGVRHLINLALASPHPTPAHIVFVSSIGTLRNIDRSKPVLETPIDATVAAGTGYSESKWVSERMLAVATEGTGVPTVSVRVGQVTGSRNGAWNPAEWFPALVKSSVYLGYMPLMNNAISWLPVDAIAHALIEMRYAPSGSTLHLAHPHPTRWNTVCSPIAEHFSLQPISYPMWLAKLEKSGQGLNADEEVELVKRNPALKILPFFREGLASAKEMGRVEGEGASDVEMEVDETTPEAMGLPRLDVSLATQAAPSLRELAPLDASDAMRWVAFWKEVGHLA